MKLYLRRLENMTLAPLNDSDYDLLKRIKPGDDVLCEIKKPRNLQFHKKFFSLLNLGFNNTKSGINDIEIYRQFALINIGYCEVVDSSFGKQAIAKSISFANIDDTEFEILVYKPMIRFIISDTGASEDDIINNYVNYF